jgi:hypothetical protein
MKKWIKHTLWTVVPFAVGNLILIEYQDTIGLFFLGLIIMMIPFIYIPIVFTKHFKYVMETIGNILNPSSYLQEKSIEKMEKTKWWKRYVVWTQNTLWIKWLNRQTIIVQLIIGVIILILLNYLLNLMGLEFEFISDLKEIFS